MAYAWPVKRMDSTLSAENQDYFDDSFDYRAIGSDGRSFIDGAGGFVPGGGGFEPTLGQRKGGKIVRVACFVSNACLTAAGAIGVGGFVYLRLRGSMTTACCCQPVLPVTGAAATTIGLLLACLSLAVGLPGLVGGMHRRVRVGLAISAVAATGCALVAANTLGLVLLASRQAFTDLLSVCGLSVPNAAGSTAIDATIAGVGSSVVLVLLGHAWLSWALFYRYSRSGGAYDGEYNLAEVRRARWRRRRLQMQQRQRQQQQLFLLSPRPTSGSSVRDSRGSGVGIVPADVNRRSLERRLLMSTFSRDSSRGCTQLDLGTL